MNNQFLLFYKQHVCFQNRRLEYKDIPKELKNNNGMREIAGYNDFCHGVITENFFKWALQNNVDYASIQWFIEIFSGQKETRLTHLVNAFFKKYRIFFDETGNCVKFRFKNEDGDTNVKWFNDFVIAGVVYDYNLGEFDIDSLFNRLKLQKNIKEVKLKHLVKYNGQDKNRLLNILKSKKLRIVFQSLNDSKSVFIHWSTENLLYFSLADIVDSVLENDDIVMHDRIKNIIYEYAINNNDFLSTLAKYNYPNIKEENVEDFCEFLLECVDDIKNNNIAENAEDDLLVFKKEIKHVMEHKRLVLLFDNIDKMLIETFVHNYALRIANFPNSELYFDQCAVIEEKIDDIANLLCFYKMPKYEFIDSTSSKWIQLSDIVAGVTGAFMAYINTHNESAIKNDLKQLDEIQKDNLKLYMQLRTKSLMKNIYFDHMSSNSLQGKRILFIQDEINNIVYNNY